LIEKGAFYISDEKLKNYLKDIKEQVLNEIESDIIENGLADSKLFEIILKCRKKDILIRNE
jgi:hypothetical protein